LTLTLTGTPDQTSGTLRPSTTEFHAGRVFYAGVNAQGYNSKIYFSAIAQSPVDFGMCMSTLDPTSSTLSDFLPSDGGVIAIPQAGTIYKLVSLGTSLLVFGANGVWSISGSTGVGFEATDYQVSLVGLTRSISGTSFVSVDGSVAWWNSTSINMLQADPQKGLTIQSMTDSKIKDYYLSLSTTSKRFARGVYNPREHTIRWIFRDDSVASVTETYSFNSILSFNTLVNAWYTWSIPNDVVAINSVVVEEGAASLTATSDIVSNAASTVVDNLGNTLTTYGFAQTTVTTTTKYLVSYPNAGSYKFTFGECFNNVYRDWFQHDSVGEDYTSFFITGYRIPTQGERNFQTNYIFVFSDTTSPSAYTFQAQWNYGNTGNTGEWSQRQSISQNVAHTSTNYDATRRRLKVRGAGAAVQFKFSSVSGKPFTLVGWSTYDTANASS
jgi:hypothetical protein